MSPRSLAAPALHTPVMTRAFALGMIAAILMATTMLVASPAPVGATETEPTNCGVVPIDLVIILDRSGSMGTDEGSQDRIDWAQDAAHLLVNALDASTGGAADIGDLHRVGLTTFGNGNATSLVLLAAAAPASVVNAAIDAVSPNGGTPFDLGMSTGAANMTAGDRALHGGVEVTQVLVFLSDGNPDPDSFTPDAGEIGSYLAVADKAYAVAIGADGGSLGSGGSGVSYALMRQIAKPAYVSDANPGGFRAVTNASGLPDLFSELYQEIACPGGKLEVRKSLDPTNDPGRFDLWIGDQLLADEAGHDGTTGEQSVAAGTHTFTETADDETSLANYLSSVSCLDGQTVVTAVQGQGASWSVDVTADADIVCTITNTRITGTLTVTKVVTNDDGGTAECDDYSFSVNGGSAIGFEADGCSNVLTLPTGTYTVSEPAVPGYDTTYDNCAEIAVINDQNVTCTITNDDILVIPGAPTLTVAKSASTDVITISGPAAAPVATPSVVTWTLSYTLTNGPVTGVVITDAVPAGFTFLDATNGGTFAGGSVTWNLGNVNSSGSVSFRTTVNPATISRVAPTVNTAVIDSNETSPDNGTDSVTVTVQAPPLGGNPTPRPALPNTAMAIGDGEPVTVPVQLLMALFLGSLGALAVANARATRR